jgi:hypothetical protein
MQEMMASDYAGITAPQPMPNKAYLVRFKKADLPPELVVAETIEFQGEHLVFLRSTALWLRYSSWRSLKVGLN